MVVEPILFNLWSAPDTKWLSLVFQVVAALLALYVATARWSQKFGDFPIVGDRDDLHGALKRGTELVCTPLLGEYR
jgi:hypothetical protein